MTEDAIRTIDGRSESGCAVLILIDHGTITISDGELTDQTANHLRLDMENAGKLGKVLVALAAAFETDATRDGDAKRSGTERSDDERALLRSMAARAARASGSSGWTSDQLSMLDTLASRGADREDFNSLTPERFIQFCEAWLQMDDRIGEAQCRHDDKRGGLPTPAARLHRPCAERPTAPPSASRPCRTGSAARLPRAGSSNPCGRHARAASRPRLWNICASPPGSASAPLQWRRRKGRGNPA